MTATTRTIVRKSVVAIVAFICVAYLLVCLVPFLHPGHFWMIAVLGFIFPFLVPVLLIIIIILAFKKWKWSLVVLGVLLMGWNQISAMLPLRFTKPGPKLTSDINSVKVLTWNVYRWDEQNRKKKGGFSNRDLMLDAVASEGADVLCLQEFFEPNNSTKFKSNLAALRERGYAHSYFFPSDIIVNGEYQFGLVIASRFPILDTAKFSFGKTPHSEGLIYADIRIGGKTVRFFSTHLESARFTDAVGSGNKLRRLRESYHLRYDQATIVRQQIDASPYPVVLCGNLGNTPNSNTYFRLRKGLQDAHIEHGSGLGRTFRFLSPTLRIDYILADKRLDILDYHRPDLHYSDHYPLVAEIALP